MSTRCHVKVVQNSHGSGKQEASILLYHHCDGYPSNMIPVIRRAWEMAKTNWEGGECYKAASFLCAADPGQMEPLPYSEYHGDVRFIYVVRVSLPGETPLWEVEILDGKEKSVCSSTDIRTLLA